MDEAHECHYDAPGDHGERQPDMRFESFEEDIGGDFEDGVGNEEDCQTEIILSPR